MAESTETLPGIQISIKGPAELKLQIDIAADKTVLELKQAIAEKSDVEADRQRLIYSGRVLKDEDALSKYKIQSGHTVHMVKGAARASGSSGPAPGASSSPQPLPSMQTGQNVHDPLSQLNSHLAFGHNLGNFNPFADLGLNQNDPNMLANMFNSPEFVQQMTSLISNPQILEQIIASNPELSAMGPQVREIFQSEGFRQMMSNPDAVRRMMNLTAMLRGAGAGGPPAMQQPSFPAPGGHSGAPAPAPGTPGSPASAAGNNGAGVGAGLFDPNLIAQILNAGSGANAGAAGAGTGAGGAGAFGGLNPLLFGGLGGLGGFGGSGLGGAASPPPPTNLPPPEERFQVQLQQLQDMGFTNAQQNVRALLATGGNVHSAIEYILGGGGL